MTAIEIAPPSFLSRAHDELEVKRDGRTVYGIVVPYDKPARVNDGWGPYTESFKRGAFDKWMRRNNGRAVKLMVNHEKRRLGIGRHSLLRDDAAGLYGEFRISETNEGNDALTLARDGVVDAFSVGFEGVKDRKNADGVVERTEVILREVSMVSFPAYEEALIAGVRNLFEVSDEELARLVELVRAEPALLDRLTAEVHPARSSEPPDEGDDSAHDEGASESAESERTATTVPVAVDDPHPTGRASLEQLRHARELMGRRMQLVLRDQERYL